MKLMSDGHLKVFEWIYENFDSFGWTVVTDLTTGFVDDCSYPLVCGRNAICSNQQCSCPTTKYFKPVDDRQPNLGCSELTPLTCDSTQDHDFITLKNVKYFTSAADMLGVNMETCKQACHKNCSCKAAFFQYYLDVSSGKCFLLSEIFTMKSVDPREINALAFIKVQNVTSHHSSHQVATIVGSTIGSFVLLLVVAIGIITYVVTSENWMMKWRKSTSINSQECRLSFPTKN
ncbi:putative non-specific serine/threonine protein kinase [Helianthus annuus]|nr:putative non-specific serine/threonine protein kinase [Helianthus annuus]